MLKNICRNHLRQLHLEMILEWNLGLFISFAVEKKMNREKYQVFFIMLSAGRIQLILLFNPVSTEI